MSYEDFEEKKNVILPMVILKNISPNLASYPVQFWIEREGGGKAGGEA